MTSASGAEQRLVQELEEAARLFQALGDPTRLALLRILGEGERTVGDLVRALNAPQPKISQHLKVLREAGIVTSRRDGRQIWYGQDRSRIPPGIHFGVHPAARVARRAPGRAAPVTRGGDLETHLL
jgi:DNA-binding transcriptional ArsR family regulator